MPHAPGDGERTMVMTDTHGRRFTCGLPPPSANESAVDSTGPTEEVSRVSFVARCIREVTEVMNACMYL